MAKGQQINKHYSSFSDGDKRRVEKQKQREVKTKMSASGP